MAVLFISSIRTLLRTTKLNSRYKTLGENKLDRYMKMMFETAGIDITNRKITGHSGKRTMCSKLCNAGFDENIVKLKSGNRSDAVRAYQVPNIDKKRRMVSDVLTPGIKKLLLNTL